MRRLRDYVVGADFVLIQQGQAAVEQDQRREGVEGPAGFCRVESIGHRSESGIVDAEVLRTENFADGAQHVRRRVVG